MNRKREVSLGELWDSELSFGDGECRYWRIGPCRFWIERRRGEWRVAFEEQESASERVREGLGALAGGEAEVAAGVARSPEAGLFWYRFVTGSPARIAVRPALPDRPVVVRPRSPVAILAGEEARFFIRLPVWISLIESESKRSEPMLQRPVVRLSNTWFGEPDNGELCYAFPSPLSALPEEEPLAPYTVVCPIAIRNETGEALDFQRICVRAQYLSLYAGKRNLATNEVVFHYRGPDQSSQITFSEEPPAFEPIVRRIAGPRVSPTKSLIQKSFEYIKSLTTY